MNEKAQTHHAAQAEISKSKPELNAPASIKGIYLLPNLFTTAGLFAGFYSIVSAMQHKFELACITILIAMIADGLDGRVARLTNTQSEFGAEYDSLSDMVAFGLAPALLIYSWSLHHLGKLGWLIAFFYVACTGLRLARFNTQSEDADKRYYKGIACTAAAGVLASVVWYLLTWGLTDGGKPLAIVMAVFMVLIAALQVSNVKFYSFKTFGLKGVVPFMFLVLFVIALIALVFDPPRVLFFAFIAYLILGPIIAWRVTRKD